MTTQKKAGILIFLGGTVLALLAVLGYIVSSLGVNGTIFHAKSINYFGLWTWNYVEVDIYAYLKGLETAFTADQFQSLTINVPELPTLPNAKDVIGWISYIAKILAVFIPNIVIMLINTILTPFKLILYPARILTALIGIDTTQEGFLGFVDSVYRANIPFILYW